MYTSFFGLTEEPFGVTPDPKFIYFSRHHREAFSLLLYGVENRKGFIQITGEIGAGKTTLCRKLICEMGGKARTSFILNPNLSEGQLLQAIVEDFGILPRPRNRKECFDRLNRFLLEGGEAGIASVLIIDEAQNLSPRSLEQVRLLSNLETDQKKLLQIVLVGQPELRDSLNSSSLTQLRQRIVVRYHLPALDMEETTNYINHRLRVAEGEGRVHFTPEAIASIYADTQGVPRLINALCDRAMLVAFIKESKEIDEPMIAEAQQEIEGIAVQAQGV